jgi:hypothetical protein
MTDKNPTRHVKRLYQGHLEGHEEYDKPGARKIGAPTGHRMKT